MSGKVSANTDLREFQEALKEYLTHSRLDASEAVNKKAGDVAFSAIKGVPDAVEVRASINRDVPKGNPFWHALATGKTKAGVTKKGAAVKGKGNKKLADALYASRMRHVNYSRALFLKLAGDMGKPVRGLRKTSKIQNTEATKARASLSLNTHEAVLQILGVDSEHGTLLDKAIAKAIRAEIADMRKYIDRKLSERARKHSGRRR